MMASRRLAAIMFTDMVGFSALTYQDEQISKEVVEEQRRILRSHLTAHGGVENQTTGDGFLIEFSSAVSAVRCAIDIQTALHEKSKHLAPERKIEIRIGIHLGDIVVENQQMHGNGVNVAARIETLASPGGICISQQIYDQVAQVIKDVSFRKLGHKKLKNIESGVKLFSVVLPWQKKIRRGSILSRFKFKSVSLATGLASILFVTNLIGAAVVLRQSMNMSSEESKSAARSPTSLGSNEFRRINLETDWQYYVDQEKNFDESSPPSLSNSNWKNFESQSRSSLSQELQGHYWLKKVFKSNGEIKNPSLVLGLIGDRHRVYLNGKFVGGSDHLSDVGTYVFDQSLFDPRGENTILVDVISRTSLDPGLTVLPNVGAFIADFSTVRQAVLRNQITFHLARSIYLVLSVLMFISCFILSIYKNLNRGYFYASFYLLLGSTFLIYYIPWVSEAYDYRFVRFIKVFSLTMPSIMLLSGYLDLIHARRAELLNNLAGMLALGTLVYAFLVHAQTPDEFLTVYNGALVCGVLYSLSWALYQFCKICLSWKRNASHLFQMSGIFLLFGFLGNIPLIAALHTHYFSHETLTSLKAIGVAIPFLFAVVLMFSGTINYIRKSRASALKKSRDHLTLELVRLMSHSKNPLESIQTIQQRAAAFVGATKSTNFAFDHQSQVTKLKLVFDLEKTSGAIELKKNLNFQTGIIGYVIKNQSPLLIKNVRTDSRFANNSKFAVLSDEKNYRTGSCMVLPLFFNAELIGVMTFADKKEDESFTKDDFMSALELTSVLGILIGAADLGNLAVKAQSV